MDKTKKKPRDRLAAYGAATAATVMAGAGSAQASITLYNNGGSGWVVPVDSQLSISYDGTVAPGTGGDFSFRNRFFINTKKASTSTGSRGMVNDPNNSMGSYRFAPGAIIGFTNVGFGGGFQFTSNGAGGTGGFAPGDRGFVGLKFNIGADTFFGWGDISLSAFGPEQTLTLNAYAVENESGVPVNAGVVPEPSTLSLLALGAAGLAALRRRIAV